MKTFLCSQLLYLFQCISQANAWLIQVQPTPSPPAKSSILLMSSQGWPPGNVLSCNWDNNCQANQHIMFCFSVQFKPHPNLVLRDFKQSAVNACCHALYSSPNEPVPVTILHQLAGPHKNLQHVFGAGAPPAGEGHLCRRVPASELGQRKWRSPLFHLSSSSATSWPPPPQYPTQFPHPPHS